MAKIGTAHVEIKPVLDEDALTRITDSIAAAVRAGVRRGMAMETNAAVIDGECHECPADGSVHDNSSDCPCGPRDLGYDENGLHCWMHHPQLLVSYTTRLRSRA